MLSTPHYIPLAWEHGRWNIRHVPASDGDKAIPMREWLSANAGVLPEPRYRPGSSITFRHETVMRGTVQLIEMSVKDGVPGTIYYTAYANGHGRWFAESDIVA